MLAFLVSDGSEIQTTVEDLSIKLSHQIYSTYYLFSVFFNTQLLVLTRHYWNNWNIADTAWNSIQSINQSINQSTEIFTNVIMSKKLVKVIQIEFEISRNNCRNPKHIYFFLLWKLNHFEINLGLCVFLVFSAIPKMACKVRSVWIENLNESHTTNTENFINVWESR